MCINYIHVLIYKQGNPEMYMSLMYMYMYMCCTCIHNDENWVSRHFDVTGWYMYINGRTCTCIYMYSMMKIGLVDMLYIKPITK